ncbi:MAG: (d)CMP kinase [Oscillospiraceae bacterium]|nr:(d)CMP kinase [Oscillospiraceae bacterium]
MFDSKPIAVAIDGPVGAGKSSIARTAAQRLGFIYCDTGALYRAVGLYCHRNGVDLNDAGKVAEQLDDIKLDIRLVDGTQRVFLNGADVSEDIRLPEISMAASAVSRIPEVRAALLDLQRDTAAKSSAIMDGRDIGTVVLPNADVKIFLTASPEIRAKRRFDELIAKGGDVKFDDVLRDLNERDYADMHRDIAPLKQAEDAVLADTSELDFEQSVELVCGIIRGKTEKGCE